MRMEKVNALIKREIGNMMLLGEIRDPRITAAPITIQSVDTSKDLHHARVRFSILSDKEEDIKSATDGLNSCRGYVRKLLAERVELRYTPEVQFFYDKSVKYAAEIEAKIAEIQQLKKADDES
jgi:ribosome-binding factor A